MGKVKALHSRERRLKRAELIKIYGLKCFWCEFELALPKRNTQPDRDKPPEGKRWATIDHKQSWHDGGSKSSLSNLVLSCRECNHNRSLDQQQEIESKRNQEMANVPTEAWVLPRPRKDAYVGSFPLHFEKKLMKLLGSPLKVLQPFGGLCEIGDSVDLNATTLPTWVGDAHDMNWISDNLYDLVLLDPPYSDEEAEMLYSTPPLKWNKFVREAVRVAKVGGHVAIYHVKQPPRPEGTKLIHRVVVLTTETWHTARICFIFEKL